MFLPSILSFFLSFYPPCFLFQLESFVFLFPSSRRSQYARSLDSIQSCHEHLLGKGRQRNGCDLKHAERLAVVEREPVSPNPVVQIKFVKTGETWNDGLLNETFKTTYLPNSISTASVSSDLSTSIKFFLLANLTLPLKLSVHACALSLHCGLRVLKRTSCGLPSPLALYSCQIPSESMYG